MKTIKEVRLGRAEYERLQRLEKHMTPTTKNKEQFTAGGWKWERCVAARTGEPSSMWQLTGPGILVADYNLPSKADQNLLTAAPELYEACKLFIQYDEENCQTGLVEWAQLKDAMVAALAKANGE